MALPEVEDSLLTAPSDQKYELQQREHSNYKSFDAYELEKEKHYQQQYGDMYFLRLTCLKPFVERNAAEAWDGFQVAGETVRKVDRVLDVRQGELCWVSGTIYMEMPLKPNILDDIAKDHWSAVPEPLGKYISPSGEDQMMLEDESGRLRLTGTPLLNEILVTGCIIAVMGTENANGDFDVVDIRVPDLPPQPKRWGGLNPSETEKSEERTQSKTEEDVAMDMHTSGGGKKIAIVSGLGFSGKNSAHFLQLDLLSEFLLGEALDPNLQQEASKISRLIIAGNSISTTAEIISESTTGNGRKLHKKYGYDSSAYNPAPTAHFDNFLSTILPSIPVTVIPGASDPANVSMPQQPIHSAIFPLAKAYTSNPVSGGESKGHSWFDSVTNPWEGEVEGWKVLGTGGQNVDDVFKYVETESRIKIMEAMCRWRCCAPTAPDTLWSYPFQDDDPFVLDSCPHLYIVGSQPKFETTVIEGPEGQMARLIAAPRFEETGEIILVDTDTLETSIVKFAVPG
ncbi:hypothetical protein B7463_g1702, partial [Scytalidium lignicola]